MRALAVRATSTRNDVGLAYDFAFAWKCEHVRASPARTQTSKTHQHGSAHNGSWAGLGRSLVAGTRSASINARVHAHIKRSTPPPNRHKRAAREHLKTYNLYCKFRGAMSGPLECGGDACVLACRAA